MVIPADWKEVKVANVIVDSFSGPSPTCLERNIQGEEWGVFKTTCSTMEQGWDYTKHKVLPRAFWGMTRSLIKVGDTVITKAGPRHRVGVASYVNLTLDRLIVSGKMIGLRPNKTVVCPPFLALALSSKPTQEFLNQRTTGMAESQVNFENVALLETPLYLPSLKEQEAIAEALSDVDALIDSLDALIAKKRDVKQATMQQLLTGCTRLPGFTADWKEVRLGDLVSRPITDGPHLTPRFYDDGVPFLSVNNIVDGKILWNELRYISKEDDKVFSVKCKPRRGDILFGKAASVGKIALVDTDLDFNVWSPLAVIRCSTLSSSQFVYFALQTTWTTRQIALLTNSSSQGNIGMTDIAQIQISLPPLKEQETIAEVLSAMDDELEALTERVSKLRMVKEGMMQDLLTGKVRLV